MWSSLILLDSFYYPIIVLRRSIPFFYDDYFHLKVDLWASFIIITSCVGARSSSTCRFGYWWRWQTTNHFMQRIVQTEMRRKSHMQGNLHVWFWLKLVLGFCLLRSTLGTSSEWYKKKKKKKSPQGAINFLFWFYTASSSSAGCFFFRPLLNMSQPNYDIFGIEWKNSFLVYRHSRSSTHRHCQVTSMDVITLISKLVASLHYCL